MKELKNKVDSIRRTLKAQGIVATTQEIESKILELCPDFPDDWNSDVRSEVIKALSKTTQSTELATVENQNVSTLHSEEVATVNNVNTLSSNVNSSVNTSEISGDDSEDVFVSDTDTRFAAPMSSSAITLQEKSELVATTAIDMGIQLSIEEVASIAQNFDASSQDSDYELSEIETAITAFVAHKAQLTKQKINSMISNVRETVHRFDTENSQVLNDGLKEINQDIKSSSQRFKSQVRTALQCFALPPSKPTV